MVQAMGEKGEKLAIDYLKKENYDIIDTNWHCQWGEIDIIAKSGSTWVFCEVKTRTSTHTQQAFMSITARKQKKMIASAQQYLHDHDLDDAIWRIDAIGIAINKQNAPKIDHVEDALDW